MEKQIRIRCFTNCISPGVNLLIKLRVGYMWIESISEDIEGGEVML